MGLVMSSLYDVEFKIFSEIINQLTSKYSIDQKLIPTYRFIENDKYLYIVLKFFKNTEYNPYTDKDLYFSITLDDKFPQSFPVVKSLSNFSFPSLYDNSDLYRNILLFQIVPNRKLVNAIKKMGKNQKKKVVVLSPDPSQKPV